MQGGFLEDRQLVIKDLFLKPQAEFVSPTEELACVCIPWGEKPVDILLDWMFGLYPWPFPPCLYGITTSWGCLSPVVRPVFTVSLLWRPLCEILLVKGISSERTVSSWQTEWMANIFLGNHPGGSLPCLAPEVFLQTTEQLKRTFCVSTQQRFRTLKLVDLIL